MIDYKPINANESGLLVRTKLNEMLSALINGDKGVNSIWARINNSYYPSIIEWSGIIVEGVTYSAMSKVVSGVPVYDKLKKSFLLQVQALSGSFSYFNNWAGRELLQDNVYTGNAMNDIRQVKGVLGGTLAQISPSPEDIFQGKTVTLTASNVYIYDGKVVYSGDPDTSYMLISSDNSYFIGAENYVDSNGNPLPGVAYLTDDGRMFGVGSDDELSEISFDAGFKPNAFYKATNGDVWIATSSDQLTKLFGVGSASLEVDDALSETSENPVQNKVITGTIKDITSFHDAGTNQE